MNDSESDNDRRDRMAIAAAPYVHERPSEKTLGKKEQQLLDAEKIAGAGRFATPPPPGAVASE